MDEAEARGSRRVEGEAALWRPGRALRAALCVGVFLTALLAAGAKLPPRDIGVMGAKLRDFYATGPYDVAFLGSSHVAFHLSPEVFDEASGLRSYNLGLPGSWQAEISYLADRLIRQPNGVRYAVISLMPWPPDVNFGDLLDPQSVQWHDLRRTLVSVRVAMENERRDAAENHLRAFAMKRSKVGAGLPGANPPFEFAPTRGQQEPRFPRFHRERYEKELARYFEGSLRRRVPYPVQAEDLRRSLRRLKAAGIEPVLMVHPIVGFLEERELARGLAELYTVVDFGDPLKFPELFDPEVRIDHQHLNQEGARMISRMTGERFASVIAYH
jgi:hypothetical protein